MVKTDLSEQFQKANIRLNQKPLLEQQTLTPNINPIMLKLYKFNAYFAKKTEIISMISILVFAVLAIAAISGWVKPVIIITSIVLLLEVLVVISLHLSNSLINHWSKYKMNIYAINDDDSLKDKQLDSHLKYFTKKQIWQLWQHGFELISAYQKADWNMARLPAEWQWLNQKGYQFFYDNLTWHYCIAKNSLIIATFNVDYIDEKITNISLFNIKAKEKSNYKYSGSLLFIDLSIIAIFVLLFIGNNDVNMGNKLAIIVFVLICGFSVACLTSSMSLNQDVDLKIYYDELNKNKTICHRNINLVQNYFLSSKRI